MFSSLFDKGILIFNECVIDTGFILVFQTVFVRIYKDVTKCHHALLSSKRFRDVIFQVFLGVAGFSSERTFLHLTLGELNYKMYMMQ